MKITEISESAAPSQTAPRAKRVKSSKTALQAKRIPLRQELLVSQNALAISSITSNFINYLYEVQSREEDAKNGEKLADLSSFHLQLELYYLIIINEKLLLMNETARSCNFPGKQIITLTAKKYGEYLTFLCEESIDQDFTWDGIKSAIIEHFKNIDIARLFHSCHIDTVCKDYASTMIKRYQKLSALVCADQCVLDIIKEAAAEVESEPTVSGAPQSSAMSSAKDAKRPIAIVKPFNRSILKQYEEAIDKIATQEARAPMVKTQKKVRIMIKDRPISLAPSAGLNLYYLLIVNDKLRTMVTATPEDQQQISDIMKKCKSAMSAYTASSWKDELFDNVKPSALIRSKLIKCFATLKDSISSELSNHPDILARHQELSALVGADQCVLDIIKKAAAEVESEPTVSGAQRMSSADVSAAASLRQRPAYR